MTSPILTISDGDEVKATPLMTLFNDLYGKFPVTSGNISSVLGTTIDWTGATVPASALPTIAPIPGSANSELDSDPMQVLGQGLQYTRRNNSATWASYNTTVRFPAPILGGFLFCQGDNVIEVPRSSTGTSIDTLTTPLVHAGTAGDSPVHAVALSSKIAYVSCQDSKKIKTIALGSSSSLTAWLDLSATYTGLGKISTNRDGTKLYVIAKKTGTNYKFVLQINVATRAVSECAMADDYDVVDVFVSYGGDATLASGNVFICQKQTTAGGVGKVYYAIESSYPSAPTGTVLTLGATYKAYTMVCWRGKAAVIAYDSGGADTYLYICTRDYDAVSAAYGATTMLSAVIGAVTPIEGSGASVMDGQVAWLDTTGYLWITNPVMGIYGTSGFIAGYNATSAVIASPCGVAYTGKSIAVVNRVSATGNGKIYVL